MQNLLDLDMAGLKAWLAQIGEKPFRANQLLRWIYSRGESDFAAMTDLARTFRERLPDVAEIRLPKIVSDKISDDGTRKFLMDVGASNLIETVFIPEADRGTLCVSTQVGCALDCSFCSTGKQGFNRNLTTSEIIGQLWLANQALGFDPAGDRIISNVVIMGMGEPLANFEALVPALNLMLDDHAYGLSRRRVTVSTSGIVPAMDRLREACPTALAVSLHAPNDALRDVLVPINQKYPLAELMAACKRYLENAPRDFITFEYCMLDGVNDQPEHAQALIDLVRPRHGEPVSCKFNLIPFNPFPASGLKRSAQPQVQAFAEILQRAGLVTTVRKTRGDDIDAACGQLAGDVKDRTGVEARMARQRVIPLRPASS